MYEGALMFRLACDNSAWVCSIGSANGENKAWAAVPNFANVTLELALLQTI